MNGAQLRGPLDSAKYAEQYLSNLRLEASNNDRNLQANLVFKLTGQNPQQLTDFRTTTEKAADFEGTKVALRSKLGTITDGIIASQIIGELSQDQILFALNKWPTIQDDMKKQYATGVPSSVFISYLNRLISKYEQMEGVDTGLQQNMGEAIIMSNIQLLHGLPRGQIWSVLKSAIGRAEKQFGLNLDAIKEKINHQEALIPSEEDLQFVNGLRPENQIEVKKLFDEIFDTFPTTPDLVNAVGQLNLGMANRDKRFTTNEIRSLDGLITISDSADDNMRQIREIAARDKMSKDSEEPEDIVPSEFVPLSREEWGTKSKKEMANYLNSVYEFAPYVGLDFTKGTKTGPKDTTRFKSPQPLNYKAYTKEQMTQMYESSIPLVEGLMSRPSERSRSASEGSGMRGTGLKKHSRSITHLVDKPIDKPKPYTQFGRYFVNKQRLHEKDILAFRSPSGGNIQHMPTEKVSPSFAHVMRTLIGNGLPTYEEIGRLSQDEKRKLSTICHKCHVDSPAIPNMKGECQAEDDRFSILKGELAAGNDSPKIAREFKTMLLKYMNEGRIPKQQCNEILHELLVLGL